MKKFFLYLFLIIFLINLSNAVTVVNITSCGQTINQAYIGGSGTQYHLIQDISISGSTCLTITGNDTYLDGQGYKITGNNLGGTKGIFSKGYSFGIYKNLNIQNFDIVFQLEKSKNNSLININSSNNNN